MKKHLYQIIVLFLSGILSTAVVAEEATTTPTVEPPQAGTPEGMTGKYVSPDMTLVRDVCPPVESLVRDPAKQTWVAPNGWKTNSPSFLHTLDTFVGAQWVGVSIGEIICVYTKASRNTFPVTLQRGKLVPSPVGKNWSADKGGFMECKSNDVQQCSFFTQIPKPPKNIYEELNFYKGKPVEE